MDGDARKDVRDGETGYMHEKTDGGRGPDPYPPPSADNVFDPGRYPLPSRRRRKARHALYLPAAEMLMLVAGLLGIVYWFSHFLLGYYYDTIEVDVEDEWSRGWFGFSVIMLLSSLFLFLGPHYLQVRDFRMSFFSALLGIFSFGWFIGSVMSAISLVIIVHSSEEFERPQTGLSRSEPGSDAARPSAARDRRW